MTARWTHGSYGGDGFADMMESMSVTSLAHIKFGRYVSLEFCAWWTHMENGPLPTFDDAAAADAAEHERLCRILATNRPIRFPRRAGCRAIGGGWWAKPDTSSGREYYVHEATGERTWTHPTGRVDA